MNIGLFKNIIFDLGGVIINLSEGNTLDAFDKLQGNDYADHQLILNSPTFKLFEKGLIGEDQFRAELRTIFHLNASDQQIDDAMNAMLLDIPQDRLALLQKIGTAHQLFLLSNTNSIHMKCFNQILFKTSGRQSMDYYFERAYYSHLVHMRKPDPEIFELVLNENHLNPSETLFLDDNPANLAGATAVGIKTFHIENPSQLFELF